MTLLDTHVLVWLVEANPRLGRKALQSIDEAFQDEHAAVSAISFWEVGTLVRKERLKLHLDPAVWRDELIRQGLVEFPIDGEIGLRAAGLRDFHGDPADRIIAATALQHSMDLVTADHKLLDSGLAFNCIDAKL